MQIISMHMNVSLYVYNACSDMTKTVTYAHMHIFVRMSLFFLTLDTIGTIYT